VRVDRYADARAFLDAAGPWLALAEVENSVLLTIAAASAAGAQGPSKAPYFAAAIEGPGIECCSGRTPPHRVLVTAGTARAAAALAADAFDVFGRLPGVVGPREAARAFADAWVAVAGGRATVGMRQRIHRIDRVSDALPAVRGRLRPVDAGERALAVEWAVAFAREATPDAPSEAEEAVDRQLRAGNLHFWDDDGPVAICASAGGTENVARINFVYTPPGLRRHGYATAAVSALTRQLLHDGRRYCCLYTDLANPTSNSVYRRIGYRPVCDVDLYTFADGPAPDAA
jgi:RimJ/RimL family protein N-acetyltransferase